MYILMKSEQTKLGYGAAKSQAYEQKEVAHYADFDAAVAACDKANREIRTRHYVLNDSGQELYAGTWID
jgi:cellobiose-specific phosphotransferase system component IIA